jgi:hypothetical protein
MNLRTYMVADIEKEVDYRPRKLQMGKYWFSLIMNESDNVL